MATLREYFDADFNYAVRIHAKLQLENDKKIDVSVLYDFSGYKCFVACYVPDSDVKTELFSQILQSLHYGKTALSFDGQITLPAARFIHGELQVKNDDPLDILVRFFDEPTWISIREIESSRRVFIYSEYQLSKEQIILLKAEGKALGHELQFRSKRHAAERVKLEKPLAFVSHDSRDKTAVARTIALNLQKLMCPVWYDEFSLTVGDNLRESIEKGLKECKKCILILSPNFFANQGWTKREFDSIFTREILEQKKLVLPVWYGVNSKSVYDYSPSLLNVKGLDWANLGEDETCRLLRRAIADS